MVLPVSDIELYLPAPSLEESGAKKNLYLLYWFLIILAFAHLSYADFWGFILDSLFALLGYITLKRLQLSTLAFFSFLCAFNAGIDLMASVSLLTSISTLSSQQIVDMAATVHLQTWQLVVASIVVSLDAIVYSTCLVLTCKLYSELRAHVYSHLGLLGRPFLLQNQQMQGQNGQPLQPALSQSETPHGASFRPFQGRPHRIDAQAQT